MAMADLGQGQSATITAIEETPFSSTMKSTAAAAHWIFSQEIPTDITVIAGGISFSLHKYPLVSKCGCMRQLVSESADANLSTVEIDDVPGGADAFELVAKFCYGINFEISTENIAMLRCAAEYLEMTEDYAVGNLVARTEAYLNEVALTSLAGAVFILHSCENLSPLAERVRLVNRCIDAIAFAACKDGLFAATAKAETGLNDSVSSAASKPCVDWWAEDLSVLRIDLFQRVVVAMIARGFKKRDLGPILMLYAQKWLRGLEIYGKDRKKIDMKQEHEKRVVLETIVSLLPREKDAASVSFLSMLLRTAICLGTTVACRLDLEKRMSSQLAQAVVEDILIPSYFITGDTLFDVETVQRIVLNFFDFKMEAKIAGFNADHAYISPISSKDMVMVGRLMESYLAEIACDRNLSLLKFIGLAELVPEQSRLTDDGMYRAIDIYLKTHPALSDMERKKMCSLMNCQKLSREACAHAAQNDRLPVQTVVQVLYCEQQRLRKVIDGPDESSADQYPTEVHSFPGYASVSTLRKENQDLKVELESMKMRLKDIENSSTSSPLSITRLEKPPVPRKSFISSMSRKLGRLIWANGDTQSPKGRTKSSKNRRHSIS